MKLNLDRTQWINLAILYQANRKKMCEAAINIEYEVVKLLPCNSKVTCFLDADFPLSTKALLNAPLVLFYQGDLSFFNNCNDIIAVIADSYDSRVKFITNSLFQQASLVNKQKFSFLFLNSRSFYQEAQLYHLPACVTFPFGINCKIADYKLNNNNLLLSTYADLAVNNFGYNLTNLLFTALATKIIIVAAKTPSFIMPIVALAQNLNKDIYAVPSDWSWKDDSFCNNVIQEGAHLLTHFNDCFI